MFFDDYENPHGNPVNPEDLAGIPREKDSGDDNGNGESSTPARSTRIEIPEDVKQAFDMAKLRPEFSLKKYSDRLFTTEEWPGGRLRDRIFWRYDRVQEADDPDKDNIEFHEQSQCHIEQDYDGNSFEIRKFDMAPGLLRTTNPSYQHDLPQRLTRSQDGLLLNQLVDGEISIFITYTQQDLQTTSLIRSSDKEEDLERTSLNVNSEEVTLFEQGGSPLKGKSVGSLAETSFENRRLQIVNTDKEVRLILYQEGDSEKVDYEITVPKKQEMVDFETGTGVERRYKWEEDLIPEALRKDPLQPPSQLDDHWKRANLAETLGIKIQTALAA